MTTDTFEHYKLIAESTDTLIANRGLSDSRYFGFHTSLLGGIFGAIALLAQQGLFKTSLLMLALILGGIVGLLGLWEWRLTMARSADSIMWRMRLIRQLESLLPEGSPNMYTQEWERQYGRPYRFFRLASLFGIVYPIVIVIGIAGFVLLVSGLMPAWALHP